MTQYAKYISPFCSFYIEVNETKLIKFYKIQNNTVELHNINDNLIIPFDAYIKRGYIEITKEEFDQIGEL